MKKIAYVCILAAVSIPAWGQIGIQAVTVSPSPAQLGCSTQRYVNRLTVRVLPGFSGKVFVGTAGMSVSSYSNTLAVLYPNKGAHSEEFSIRDNSGDDGIDLCSIYVSGAVSGEKALVEYFSNFGGINPPTYLMHPVFAGVAHNNISLSSLISVAGTYDFSTIRAQVVPGCVGKWSVYYGSSGISTLYPNGGNLSQHGAWSEFLEQTDLIGVNGLSVSPSFDFLFVPQVYGDVLLVNVWKKQTMAGVALPSSANWKINPISGIGPFYGNDLKVRVVPGYGGKISSFTPSTGGFSLTDNYGQLFPNASGGWSEQESFGPQLNFKIYDANHSGSGAYFSSQPGYPLAVNGSFLSLSSGTIPRVLSSQSLVGSHNQSIDQAACLQSGGACSAAPQPFGYSSHVEISVIPGNQGKIFVGSCSSMNTVSLDGVYAILYPNSIGRWSERFVVDDTEGDGIPEICVTPQVPSENYYMWTVKTGITPVHGLLSVKLSGAISNHSAFPVSLSSSLALDASYLRIQAIPGGSGKITIGTARSLAQPDSSYSGYLKVLWPSQGNYNISEGFSENIAESCLGASYSSPNCMSLSSFDFWPAVASESVLVFALGR